MIIIVVFLIFSEDKIKKHNESIIAEIVSNYYKNH